MNDGKTKRLVKYHLPALLYAGLIICLSSMPDLGKSRLAVLRVDKLLHFGEYAIFAVLIFRSFSNISSHLGAKYVIYLSLLFIAFFALFDELYQGYVIGRESDALDLLFDILGATLIIVLMYIRGKHHRDAGGS
ncbi:MAG: VanZ family protein [Candidatus Zixiibacteriota bacterium]|nr:MAG: VanZ family protein [candidate division Zixibacteria bacterium]